VHYLARKYQKTSYKSSTFVKKTNAAAPDIFLCHVWQFLS